MKLLDSNEAMERVITTVTVVCVTHMPKQCVEVGVGECVTVSHGICWILGLVTVCLHNLTISRKR